MPQINLDESYEYIECQSRSEGIWVHTAKYHLLPIKNEVIKQDDDDIRVEFDQNVMVSFPFDLSPEVDVSIKYDLPGTFAPPQESLIPKDLLIEGQIQLAKVLPFEYIEKQFEDRLNFRFHFFITVRKSENLADFRQRDWIEERIEQKATYRQIRIFNRLRPLNSENNSLLLKHYPLIISDLNEEVIWEIIIFISGSEAWEVKIDAIDQPFRIEDFKSIVEKALRRQSQPIQQRIPLFLQQIYGASDPLQVVVIIPKLEPETEYKIKVDLGNPAEKLYYSTGIPNLDQCQRDMHRRLLEAGIPFGPETEKYQRVFRQLLLYRHSCASNPGYIDASIVNKTEIEGFHRHLIEKLSTQLSTEPIDIISEPTIGNSRVDLLLDGIPTELKLEDRKTATTDDIVDRYKGQAADYIARQGVPFGFLLVLDTVLDREQPTSPVDQDVRLSQVTTISGGAVPVIALIIRIPRSASDHTILARRRH